MSNRTDRFARYVAKVVALTLVVTAIMFITNYIVKAIFDRNPAPPKIVMVDGIRYSLRKSTAGKRYAYVAPLKEGNQYKGVIVVPDHIKYHFRTYPVTGVDKNTFRDCHELEEVCLPDSIYYFGDYSFSGSAIRKCPIPQGNSIIRNHAFSHCDNLQELIIPSDCHIFENAFRGCKGLKKVVFAKETKRSWMDIKTVRSGAFYGCTSLSTVQIDKEYFSIAGDRAIETGEDYESVFGACPQLTEIIAAPYCKNICVVDGILYYRDTSYLYYCPTGKQGVCRLPNEVKTIGIDAFRGCNKLEEIYLPLHLLGINRGAFLGCSRATIYYPQSAEEKLNEDDIFRCYKNFKPY